MPDWIYDLPDAVVLALFAVLVTAATAVAQYAGHHASRGRLGGSADALANAYRSVVTLAALVLAFALVQAQTNLRDTRAAIRREGSVIDSLDRRLAESGSPAVQPLRADLANYVKGIVSVEWPAMAAGHESPRVDDMLAAVTRRTRAVVSAAGLPAGLARGIEADADELDDVRDARLTAALQRLPTVFWLGIGALVALSAVMAGAVAWTVPSALATLPPAAAIGILIGLTVTVDVPMRGQSAVQPTVPLRVIQQMEKRP